MNPPKIDICIEGYNTEQTDFYISHLIDKYNTCNELYGKALAKISTLEAENEKLRSDILALSQKLSGNILDLEIINRIKKIESALGIKETPEEKSTDIQAQQKPAVETQKSNEIASFEEKLKDLRTLLST